MSTNSFIQVPPDSTGKRLHAQQHTVDAVAVHAQVLHIGSGDNPLNLQYVDARGQAYTRYAEGSPSIDAFGNLRVGTASIIGGYEYTNGSADDLFQDAAATGGGLVYDAARSEVILSAGTANGASVTRTSNRYHYYQPGVGNLVIKTLYFGDLGRENNSRGFMYGDDNNGLFWELDGTVLYVGIRSNISGTVIDTRIAQANWNADKLDGTGISGMTLDLMKANFYFLDFAWLGVGPVRFGLLGPGGERNVCHVFQNPNANGSAYMRTGSLPVRWWNKNKGATSGTSELRTICCAVYAESQVDYTFWRYCDIERLTPIEVTTRTPIFSMRVKAGSRVGIYPEALNVMVSGGDVMLEILDDATLTSATWAIPGEGLAEGDVGATAVSGGSRFQSYWRSAGAHTIDLKPVYETNDEGYHRLADDSDSYTFTLVATKLSGTTVTVAGDLNYRELR